MKKSFFIGNLGFVVLLNILVKSVWIFGIDRNVQNICGATSYGSYFALLNLCILFQILLDMGLYYHNTKVVAGNNHLLALYFPNILALKVLLSGVFAALVFAAGWLLGYHYEQMVLLGILIFNQVLLGFISYFRSNLGALHMFKRDGVISVLDRLLVIIAGGIIIYFFSDWLTINLFALLQTAAYLLTVGIAFYFLYQSFNFSGVKFKPRLFLPLLKRGLPYAALVLLMSVYMRSDAVVLERISGKEAAGIYASAYRLQDAVNQLLLLVGTMLLPMYARLLQKKENVLSLAGFSGKMMFVLCSSLAIGSVFYSSKIMPFLYPQATAYSAAVCTAIMCALPGWGLCYVYGVLLTADKKLRFLLYISLAAALLNVGLNLLLIPLYGALAAAWISVLTMSSVGLVELGACMYYYGWKINYRLGLKLLLWILGSVGIFYLSIFAPWHWIIALCFATIATIVLSFVFRIISVTQLKAIY
ncbi:MAG: oligosaccharide flippase family protein [Chitinophagales bacterium]|nr:oligosaccharide flippase family protein [Bacteroidota bacterium]MCB9043524.1 oligosaccharide flippase family protein [Chitinophagales bacterium]